MARVFNGSTQYCELTSFGNAVLPITIAAWFRPNSTASVQRVAAWTDSAVSQCAASIILNFPSAGKVANQVLAGATHQLPSSSGTFSTGTWCHAAVVSDATASRTYLDGVAGSDATYSTPSFTSATFFSAGRRRTTEYFNGRIAFLAVWSAALTADEVAALGQILNGVPCGVHPTMVRPDALVACWDFGGFAGDDDRDQCGAYDLTAYNGPTFDESPPVGYPDDVLLTGPGVSAGGGGGSAGTGNLLLLGVGA